MSSTAAWHVSACFWSAFRNHAICMHDAEMGCGQTLLVTTAETSQCCCTTSCTELQLRLFHKSNYKPSTCRLSPMLLQPKPQHIYAPAPAMHKCCFACAVLAAALCMTTTLESTSSASVCYALVFLCGTSRLPYRCQNAAWKLHGMHHAKLRKRAPYSVC
jgi:hypothetical protein